MTNDVLVPIFCQRGIEMLVSVLAVLKAGGAYVPLDPSYPKDRVLYVLNDASASIVLTQSSLLDDFNHIGASAGMPRCPNTTML